VRTAAGLILGTLLLAAPSGGQDLDRLLRTMDENRREELRRLLPTAEAKYPNQPVVLYLRGLLAEPAEEAISRYEELLAKHPQSPYADDALCRICQYYFAKGLYIACQQRCRELLSKYPDSDHRDEAEYLLASSFFARGEFDSSYAILKDFSKRYPDSRLLSTVRSDLVSFEGRSLRVSPEGKSQERPPSVEKAFPPESRPATGARYAVQVGAFRERANALRQQRILAEAGYRAEVVERRIDDTRFYLVWVGSFSSAKEADEFGRELNRRLGLPHRVVPVSAASQ
jgi:tetratricopeptide (TPR) repeat protein